MGNKGAPKRTKVTKFTHRLSTRILLFMLAGIAAIMAVFFYTSRVVVVSVYRTFLSDKTVMVNRFIATQIGGGELIPYIEALNGDAEFRQEQIAFHEARQRLFELESEPDSEEKNRLWEEIRLFYRKNNKFKDEKYALIQAQLEELRAAAGAQYLYIFADTGLPGFLTYIVDAHPAGEEKFNLDMDDIGTIGPMEDFSGSETALASKRQEENAYYDPDTHYGEMYSSYSPLFDSQGNFVAVVGTDIDLSEMNRRIQTMTAAQTWTALAGSSLFIVVFYFLLRRVVINPIVVLTDTAADIAGGRIYTELPPRLLAKKDEIGRLSKALSSMTGVFQKFLKDAEQLFHAAMAGRLDARIEPSSFEGDFALLAREVNDTLDIIGMYFDKAQSASKAKGEFLSRVSHELRSPMNVIIGMAKLGLKNAEAQSRERFESIVSASGHLLRVINDVLDMSSIESGKLAIHYAQFNPGGLILDCVNLFKHQAEEKNISLTADIASDVAYEVVGDGPRLSQILINLLTNSIKFTEPGGRISVSAVQLPNDGGNACVSFAVEDTGIGMSEAFLQKIFTPFEQEDQYIQRRYQGTGLGLSICHRLVGLMGGILEVKSQLGVGSRFTFALPFLKAEKTLTDGAAAESSAESSYDFSSINLLMVDDIELNRLVLSESLAETGINITEAADGAEALKIFKDSEEGYFNVVFMDVQMPNMDGYQATEAIRALSRKDAGLPIIAMTANALKEDIDQALAHGMSGHISKPVDFDTCVRTLAEIAEIIRTEKDKFDGDKFGGVYRTPQG